MVEEEADTFHEDTDSTDSPVPSNSEHDDIVEINVGGEVTIQSKRSTLCLVEGSMFANMFSGRLENAITRDKEGRVFVDEDPELVRVIVNFLRYKKKENPVRPSSSLPKIPEGKRAEFKALIDYFGLTEFFYGDPRSWSIDIASIDVIQPHSSKVVVTRSEKKIELSYGGPNGHYFVYCTPALDIERGSSYWKVTINTLPNYNVLNLGISGISCAGNPGDIDSTSYGWSGGSEVLVKGLCNKGASGWTGFSPGECLYFHLGSTKLTMFSVLKNKKFTINVCNPEVPKYIRFIFLYSGTKLVLEPLYRDELAKLWEHFEPKWLTDG